MYYFLCMLGIKEIRLHHIILINNVAKKEQGSESETIITDPDLESSKLTDPSGSGTLNKRIVSLVKHKSR